MIKSTLSLNIFNNNIAIQFKVNTKNIYLYLRRKYGCVDNYINLQLV